MRVTNELRDKIDRQLRDKAYAEKSAIEDAYQNEIAADINAAVKILEKAMEQSEVVKIAIETHGTGSWSSKVKTARDVVEDNLSKFFSEAYEKKEAAKRKIDAEASEKLMNVIIAISYEKDLAGIKAILAENGLTF